MTFKEAFIHVSRNKANRVSSEDAGMYSQNLASFIYWFLEEKGLDTINNAFDATDWVIERDVKKTKKNNVK